LTSADASKSFDNSYLTAETVDVSGDGLADGDTISYSFTGRQKLIGSSDNEFTYSINNTSGTEYSVDVVFGTLMVTDDDVADEFIIQMTADDSTTYDLGETVTFEITAFNPYDEPQTITLSEIDDVTLAQSSFDDVAGGSSVTTTATYTVTEDVILQGWFTNTVTGNVGSLECTAEYTVEMADIDATLSCNIRIVNEPANGEAYVLDETINYEIDVTNDGNVTYNNVQVTCEETSLSETIQSLSVGETISYITNHSVSEEDIINGSFTATVTVEGDELGDGTVPMGDDSVTTGDEDDPDGPNYPIE